MRGYQMGEILAFGVPFAVIIVWVVWRIISIKIPYFVEQIIQYVWLLINAVLLLFTHKYWNMICFSYSTPYLFMLRENMYSF